MTRFGEFIAFIGLAMAAHVGLFVHFGPSGAQSQGATGQASISLMAASRDMADRVAAWTQPVEVMQELPQTSPSAPAQNETSLAPVSRVVWNKIAPAPSLPKLAPAVAAALPHVDTQTAEPPRPRHAPQASPRPQQRSAQKPEQVATPTPKSKAGKKPRKSEVAPARSQKAKGGKSGRDAGSSQKAQSASLSKAARQSLMAKWGASIRNRVEQRKRYPPGTKASGTAVLRITISRGGRLETVSVVRSSGTASLDKAAIRAVKKARYPAAPKGLSAAQYKFNLPLAFRRN